MLEGLAAWVLNTYVGEYVENLNTDQLSIALLQGDVELENLPLKKDALKSLDIPLEVKSGVIGKIILHIPIRALRSESWSINIENLYLVAGPLTHLQYNEETEEAAKEAAKTAMLEALEAKWQILRQGKQEWATSSWFSYGTSMATNILENIQLNVKNVHIRYEDDKLNPETPFAFGVIISKLSAQSTDENWKKEFINESQDINYKLVDLNNLSIYCDSNTTLLGSLPNAKFKEAMQKDMSKDHHDFILKPISASARVKRYTSALPLRSTSTPRISVDFIMEAIHFTLSKDQFKFLGLWNREFERHNRRRKYRKNRPDCTVKQSCKKWWKFAIRCYLNEIHKENQRRTWDFVLYRSRILVDYYDSYSAHLLEGGTNHDNEYHKTKIENELDYEELKIVRELVLAKLQSENKLSSIQSCSSSTSSKKSSSTEVNKVSNKSPEVQAGLFQRWFPGWGGWYQTPTPQQTAEVSQSEDRKPEERSPSPPKQTTAAEQLPTEIEREIMDVIQDSTENSSFLRKDTIFAKMKFTLNEGSFCLLENSGSSNDKKKSVADLQCSTITMEFESRPRTSAMKFSLAVQGLHVQDTYNNFKSFPYLITQQTQASFPRSPPPVISQKPDIPDPGGTIESQLPPFCQVVFEKNPVSHFHRYRVSVKTLAIDIVYNPSLLNKIKEFFTLPSSGIYRRSEGTRNKLRELKKQTQDELQKTLSQFLESNRGKSKTRWDVNFDISAPKFIIPESLSDPNSVMVVLDLGNFKLQTFLSQPVRSPTSPRLDEDVTEDDFHTPLSTPPNETEDLLDVRSLSGTTLPSISPSTSISSDTLHDQFYERYIVDLTDLQVLQGRSDNNWRYAYSKGTSSMHVIDKFTISLQLERRLVSLADPQFPNMTISGNLPNLTFHLSESKIMALQNCWDSLTFNTDPATMAHITSVTKLDKIGDKATTILIPEEKGGKSDESLVDSKLVMFRFFINKLSLEMQSRGRALVELQVTGVEANLSHKKLNTSLALTVHSLLIVDALQSYGPDFELLVASHKNLVLDSQSGCIRGSNPVSPTSPRSPHSPCEAQSTSFHAIQDVLTQAFNKVSSATPRLPIYREPSDSNILLYNKNAKSEALISLEFEMIKSERSDNSLQTDMQILNLQFNSLDLIANQETLVELISFVNRSTRPKSRHPSNSTRSLQRQETTSKIDLTDQKKESNLHVNADFSRLNILLPRFLEENGRKVGHKIATATMSTAKVEAVYGNEWKIQGALGGLHLSDVTTDGSRYRQVFSIGDFNPSSVANEMFQTAADDKIFSPEVISSKNACSFTISKTVKKQRCLNEAGAKISELICAEFEMASVCYTHCPKFLDRLANCLSAFHDYMTVVANSLKYAATEVAYGLVGGRGDNFDITGTSFLRRDISLSDVNGILLEEGDSLVAEEQSVSVIKIVAKMETPIIVVPRAPNSSHVFLAHLGKVNITNYPENPDCCLSYEDLTEPTDKIHISLINMNCYSADLEKLGILKPLGTHLSQDTSEKSFYSMLSRERGIPIIYDTAVDLIVTQESAEVNYINPKVDGVEDVSVNLNDSVSMTTTNSVIDVSAKIKSPIKVVLCKEVYEQFLQTLDNLAYTEDVVKTSSNINQGCASTFDSENSEASPLLSHSPSETDQKVEKYLAKHFHFEVPLFEAELRGDFGDGEQGVANLKLHDFSLKFKKDNDHLTNIEFRLRSLTMEDLLESEDSLYRHIMVSRNSPRTCESKQTFLSTSCPDSTIVTPVPTMPSSLPSSFKDDPGFGPFKPTTVTTTNQTRIPFSRSQSAKASIYPCTPPPSPLGTETPRQTTIDSDDLVYIDFILVDKNSSEYVEKYNRTNRFIDIKFRCLETTVNLQTWVVLLDFLGLGAKISDISSEEQLIDSLISKTVTEDDPVNSKINFSVESFTLVLNKKDYELARANITHLTTNIEQRNGNLDLKGELGSISLLDNSPSGELYREKFISVGKQALQFDFFKHGGPDYNLQREYDMFLTLNMASVRYTHTNRFQAEILAFCQHFLQLQDVLGRMRAASAGKLITDKAMRGARIKLDIEAGSPILLIPQSSKTDSVLVADLGKLRLTNSFKHDGTPGTITYLTKIEEERKMADVMTKIATSTPIKKEAPVVNKMNESMYSQYLPKPEIDPMSASIIGSLDRDVREDEDYFENKERLPEGTSIDPSTPSPSNRSPSIQSPSNPQPAFSNDSSDTQYQCLLEVMKVTLTDMDLYTAKRVNKKHYIQKELSRVLEFPSCMVQEENGRLLEETCILELDVEHNLEGDISHTAPDWRVAGKLSSVVCHLDLQQYKLVRGILDHNLGETIEEFERPLMSHLKDPSIQTILSGEVYNCINMVFDLRNVTVELLESHQTSSQSLEVSLAKLDFIQSQLTYASSSNQSKDISLWSHAIVVSDTRYKREPMNSRPNVFVNVLQPKSESDKNELQMELNYRSTKESTQFTVLLNKMKIMCIFDWLVCVQEFLMTSPDNPFVSGEEKMSQSMLSPEPGPSRNRGASPLNISQSLATKRGPFPEEVKVPFTGRLNLQDTQLIVVGDTTSLDTSAVILQLTSVIMYKPQASDKVLTCDISTVEVFSCCLMAQDETAQSIIDPLAISVDLNANPPLNLRPVRSEGLLDVTRVMQRRLVLQVNFGILNIRVSYQDMMLFKTIMNSLPQQALQAKQSSSATKIEPTSSNSDVQQLMSVGFDKNDCFYALQYCRGNVDDAAMWLTKHAKIVTKETKNPDFALTGVEVKATSVYFCLIDDCGADVPLAELSFNGIDISQSQEPNIEGKAKLHIIGSYYNRNLSGWEPFLESWPCYIEWKSYTEPKEKLAVQVSSPDVLNLNVTSTLLKQYNETKGTWTEDYTKQTCEENKNSETNSQVPKRRSPFIPYRLINKTGCKIQFTTATTTPTSSHNESRQLDDRNIQAENWTNVSPDQEVPFKFTRKEKARHKKTHEMYHNQLLIKIDGWQKPSAVCVDKVGIYFRHADVSKTSGQRPLFPIRMKYDVKQVGSAGKIITISSALMVVNRLDSPVELKLEHNDLSGEYESMVILPDTPTPLPLYSVYYKLWARPAELSLNYSDQPIKWQHVVSKGHMDDSIRQCNPIEGPGVYRFCVCVRRENYPSNEEVANELEIEELLLMPNIPGHTITLLPPLTIQSLLPIELHYYLKHTNISGNLKAGKQAAIHAADITKDFEVGIHLENFELCKEVNIPPKLSYKYRVRLRLYDKLDRLLELTMRIQSGPGGTIGVSIAAPYWIVNKSGLPLLFKQEGTKMEAAGQFEEHEFARSVTPLLFSFNEKDEPNLVCVRLGKKHHGDDSLPQWSQKLSLENGVGTRQLHVVPRQINRPDWVYNIGYQITKGKGKFRDTHVISIAPRYEVDNQSNHKLAIAQRHLISSQNNDSAFLTALPKCKLPYHWPRMDLDQLLCVRIMDHPSCYWSGGFCVDKSKSFHLNMRDGDGKCLLLKVEIICQGPTFIIVLADADTMPPPFRLDNHSPIAVKFYQSQVTETRLQSVLHPNTSILYAWDEPILDPVLSLQIPGGMTANYNLNQLGEGLQLLYENYIYLAATHTFNRPVSCGRELVLESTHENHIIFKKKEKYKKSQMWRMTSDGLLEHYGSVQPTEPGTSKSRPRGLVLDILDMAPRPDQPVPLYLRKPDERRKSTQTWKFTENGMLQSVAGPMCVQVLGGVNLLQDGAVAMLGPCPTTSRKLPGSPPPSPSLDIPPHMMISRQKLRPGSGCLSVKVVMDGPIRVLEIADRQSTEIVHCDLKDLSDWEVYEVSHRVQGSTDEIIGPKQLEVTMSLKGGLGISVINHLPEELLYIKLSNISLEIVKSSSLLTLETSVASVQVDNQMIGASRPVVVFVTQTIQRETVDNTPALFITAHKLPSGKWNAEIYKHLIVTTKRLTILLEERLILKLLLLLGYETNGSDIVQLDDNNQQVLPTSSAIQAKRYYFSSLKIKTGRVTLSMATSSNLPPDLQLLKQSLAVPLIAFEDAKVDLDPFTLNHPFETRNFLLNEIATHYTGELKGQATKILGSIDVLGNPLGFVNDVTEGISGLIKDGNVTGLFKNVTHGVSNTAAKMTGALSDGFASVSMDDDHMKQRDEIRHVETGKSRSHLLAGVKGLGYGILGGLTGIVTQPYSGAKEKGIGGFFKGAGKGIVGTVTKPVTGVLDFTSGVANAVRDKSQVSSKLHPPRARDPRVSPGLHGVISTYSPSLARAQILLYNLNSNNHNEYIIALEYLGFGDNSLLSMVSSQYVRILKRESRATEIILTAKLNDIVKAEYNVEFTDSGEALTSKNETRKLKEKIYLKLTMKADLSNKDSVVKQPAIRCDRINIAKKVCQQINYARNLYDDETHTLIQSEDNGEIK